MNSPHSDNLHSQGCTISKIEMVAALNDAARKDAKPATTYLTLDLAARGTAFIKELMFELAAWSPPSNADETDEGHSWGRIKVEETDVNWRFEYHDLEGQDEYPDPSNNYHTVRVIKLCFTG